MFTRTTYANVTATLALVIAVGSGGAYAASLAKNAVGSKQIKNGAIKAVDVKPGSLNGAQVQDGSITGADLEPGSLTGAQVQDGSITGADVDESTLSLPAAPVTARVFEGPLTFNGTLTLQFATQASITYTVPAAGFARIEAEASFSASPTATGDSWIDALLYSDDYNAYATWDAGDRDNRMDQHQTMSEVIPVGPGSHTVSLELRERGLTNSDFSSLLNAHIDVMYFPAGSAIPPIT
jgi:hypothetical protein